MLARLLLLFTVVPALELYLLLQLGQWIGVWQTVGIILITGGLGAWFAKREGVSVLRQIQAELRQGIPPASRLIEGLLVLLGGAMLITPGVLTDLAGFALILPPTRRQIAKAVQARFAGSFQVGGVDVKVGTPAAGPAPRELGGHFDHPVK